MDDARIRQDIARPARPAVRFDHRKPDGVDAQVSIGLFVEDLLLHPPGAGDADRSRWREQQDQAWSSDVLIEQGLEPLQVTELLEPASVLLLCSLREWAGDQYACWQNGQKQSQQ